MAFPIAALAPVLGGFFNFMGQNKAIEAQQQMAAMENWFRQRQAQAQEELIRAPREDASGNRTMFTEDRGFEVFLAPIIQEIVNAQQDEQYRSLTQDASRNRAAAERQDSRSRQADEAFGDRFSKYIARRNRPEEEFQSENVRTALSAVDETNPQISGAIKQAIRSGNSSALKQLSGRKDPVSSLAAMIAAAKKQGSQEYLSDRNARNRVEESDLNFLRGIANDTPNAPVRFGNDADKASSGATSALAQLASVLANNTASVAQGMSNATQHAGKFADIGPLFNGLGGFAQAIAQWQDKQKKQNMGPETSQLLEKYGLFPEIEGFPSEKFNSHIINRLFKNG